MPSSLSRPRAIVFDWDNTLIESWVCIQKTYNATFRHFGMPEWDMAQTKGHVAASMRDSFPAMFGDRWSEAREVFTSAFAAIHLDHLDPLPGVPEVLDGLHRAGMVLAVVSNKRGPFLRREAEALGWDRYFLRLVGAEDASADKPDPAALLLALEGSGVAPSPDVWFIGDSPVDVECAARAGCTPILLRGTPPAPGEFSHDPAVTVPDWRGLSARLAELSVPIAMNW